MDFSTKELFVGLFVFQQDYAKTIEWISTQLGKRTKGWDMGQE